MNVKFGLALFGTALLIAGCEQSVEEVCQETNKILIEKKGEEFTDTAMLGCLRLGAKEAKRQQEVVKTW